MSSVLKHEKSQTFCNSHCFPLTSYCQFEVVVGKFVLSTNTELFTKFLYCHVSICLLNIAFYNLCIFRKPKTSEGRKRVNVWVIDLDFGSPHSCVISYNPNLELIIYFYFALSNLRVTVKNYYSELLIL